MLGHLFDPSGGDVSPYDPTNGHLHYLIAACADARDCRLNLDVGEIPTRWVGFLSG